MVFYFEWQHFAIPSTTSENRPDFDPFCTASVFFSLLTQTPTARAAKEGWHLEKSLISHRAGESHWVTIDQDPQNTHAHMHAASTCRHFTDKWLKVLEDTSSINRGSVFKNAEHHPSPALPSDPASLRGTMAEMLLFRRQRAVTIDCPAAWSDAVN